MSITIAEQPVFEAARPKGKGKTFPILLINEGAGSSGTYSADVLKQAAKDKVYPAGTQMFIDHPTASEKFERPERSVKDLAAVTATDATYRDGEAGPGLYAEARLMPLWADTIKESWQELGLSVRGNAEVEERKGVKHIVRMVQGISVDFVTKAGRGGKVLAMAESAAHTIEEARNVGDQLEARVHSFFTDMSNEAFGDGRLTREERSAMGTAFSAALDLFASTLNTSAGQLYQRDPYQTPGEPAGFVESQTPPAPAGTERKEPLVAVIEVNESEFAELKEKAGAHAELVQENKNLTAQVEATEVREAKRLSADNGTSAAAIVEESFKGIQAPRLKARLAKDFPVDEAGALKVDEFTEAIKAEAAEFQEAAGVGQPSGHGAAAPGAGTGAGNTSEEITESQLNSNLAGIFGRETK